MKPPDHTAPEVLRALFDSVPDCIITTDHVGRIIDFSSGAERTLGLSRGTAMGQEMAVFLAPAHRHDLVRCFLMHDQNLLGSSLEVSAVRAGGKQFPAEMTVTKVDTGSQPIFIVYLRDATQRKQSEEQMAFVAHHDKLTGLPNRAMFDEMLELALARAHRNDSAVALLYIDLDNFKLVNGSLGHSIGDELLRMVAERLAEVSRDTDFVARLGGDEFMVLVADVPRQSELTADSSDHPLVVVESPLMVAESVAARIHESLREPFQPDGTEVYVSASIGVSVFPYDAEDGRSLMKNADAAMYRSKKAGPGGFMLFPAESTDPRNKLALATRLRRAVQEQQWVLHYQPVMDLIQGHIVGVEALLRWQDPDKGLIPPNDFVSLAEEMGLMEGIGEWVLDELCRQSLLWRAQGMSFDVSFNLSPRQLWHPEFVQKILEPLAKLKVDPRSIVIEITESAAMTDPDRTQESLRTLRAKGVRFAIDDFGTGYSSLSRLRDLPVDVLKVDRSFVQDIPANEDACAMVRAIIQIARNLGMSPLAEGIETEEQWKFLVEHGCLLGQGFYFSKPVPAGEIPAAISRSV